MAARSRNGSEKPPKPHTYEQNVADTWIACHYPRWRIVGQRIDWAINLFGKSITEFHQDVFQEQLAKGQAPNRSLSTFSYYLAAWQVYEDAHAEDPALTAKVRPLIYYTGAAALEDFKEGKITAATALRRTVKENGGKRRMQMWLAQIPGVATMIKEHPHLLLEMTPRALKNALTAAQIVDKEITAVLKKMGTGKPSRKKAA